MAVVGTAVIDVVANTAKFVAGMAAAERRMTSFQSLINTAAVTSLVALTKRQIDAADAVGDLAKRVDFSVRAYQELSYAAKQLDVDQEALNSGLTRFTRTLGDAKRAGDGGVFKDLGLDPAQFKTAEQAFDAAIIKLRGVEDQSVRTSIAAKLFGKEAGPQMAQMAVESADKFERLRKEASLVGAVLSDEVVANADEASKKLAAMSSVINTQLTTSFVDLAPAIVAATGFVADFLRTFRELGSAIGIYFAQANVGSDQPFENRIAEQTLLVNNLAAAVKRAEEQSRNEGLLGRLLADDPAKLKQELAEAQAALDQLKKAHLDYLEMERQAAERRGKGGTKPQQTTFTPFVDTAAATKDAAKFEEYINDLYARNIELLTGKTQAQLQYEAALTDLNELYARGLIPNQEAYNEAVARLDKTSKHTFNAMSVYADQAARNMQSSFADFLFDPFEEGLGGMMRSFVNTMRRMVAEAMSARIFEAIGRWGMANSGSFLGNIASIFTPKRAYGGTTMPGGVYEVTEQGPEMFSSGGKDYLMSGQSGQVTPLSSGKAAGANFTFHTTIHAPGAASAELIARLGPVLDERDRRLTREFFDAMDREYAPV